MIIGRLFLLSTTLHSSLYTRKLLCSVQRRFVGMSQSESGYFPLVGQSLLQRAPLEGVVHSLEEVPVQLAMTLEVVISHDGHNCVRIEVSETLASTSSGTDTLFASS